MSIIIRHRMLWIKGHKESEEGISEYSEQECPDCIAYRNELKQLKEALSESVKLQSHYAGLLNMYDEGGRMLFANVDEWLERLRFLKII